MKDKDVVEIKKEEYQKALEDFSFLSKKRGALQRELIIETDPSRKIKFEADLKSVEIEYNKAESRLGELEEEIQKKHTPYTPVTDVIELLSNYVSYDYIDETIKQAGSKFASQHEFLKETGKIQQDIDKLKNGITVLLKFMKQLQKKYGNDVNQKPIEETDSSFFSGAVDLKEYFTEKKVSTIINNYLSEIDLLIKKRFAKINILSDEDDISKVQALEKQAKEAAKELISYLHNIYLNSNYVCSDEQYLELFRNIKTKIIQTIDNSYLDEMKLLNKKRLSLINIGSQEESRFKVLTERLKEIANIQGFAETLGDSFNIEKNT
jgi:hypothetical protein